MMKDTSSDDSQLSKKTLAIQLLANILLVGSIMTDYILSFVQTRTQYTYRGAWELYTVEIFEWFADIVLMYSLCQIA